MPLKNQSVECLCSGGWVIVRDSWDRWTSWLALEKILRLCPVSRKRPEDFLIDIVDFVRAQWLSAVFGSLSSSSQWVPFVQGTFREKPQIDSQSSAQGPCDDGYSNGHRRRIDKWWLGNFPLTKNYIKTVFQGSCEAKERVCWDRWMPSTMTTHVCMGSRTHVWNQFLLV